MYCAVVVLALVGGVLSQDHCCAPKQYEGYEDFFYGYSNPGEKVDGAIGVSRVHFDSVGQRLAITHYTKFENSGKEREFRIVDNFHERRRFFVEGDTCTIGPLDGDLKEQCVSSEARHMGDYRIGVGPNAQVLDDWEERGVHHVLTYTTTREGCFPFMYRHAHVGHDDLPTSYINIVSNNRYTAGIVDDRVFETPAECRAVRYQILPEPLRMLEERFIKH